VRAVSGICGVVGGTGTATFIGKGSRCGNRASLG
jgi:hypothetical protein